MELILQIAGGLFLFVVVIYLLRIFLFFLWFRIVTRKWLP